MPQFFTFKEPVIKTDNGGVYRPLYDPKLDYGIENSLFKRHYKMSEVRKTKKSVREYLLLRLIFSDKDWYYRERDVTTVDVVVKDCEETAQFIGAMKSNGGITEIETPDQYRF